MAVFNSAVFYNNVYFTDAGVKTGTGGIDPSERKRRNIIKPTGILHLPKKRKDAESYLENKIEKRVEETQGIAAEVALRMAQEFTGEATSPEPYAETQFMRPISEMRLAEIDSEIAMLLRKKLEKENDDLAVVLLLIASIT